MKIATWNVNSVRTRQEQVLGWLQVNPVDVLCLQETKVIDQQFPREPFEKLGYHLYISGQKAYNGVAIFSREPLEDVAAGFGSILDENTVQNFDEQKRVIAGTVGGIRIINLYDPNGASVGIEKYEYKLGWLTVLKEYLKKSLEKMPNLCVCGDFNIALEDRDIHEIKKPESHIMSSDAERRALKDILELGLADAFRKFNGEGGQFSWWDYRAASFPRNKGWRIDHHYLSSPLYEKAKSCVIDITPRTLEKPSDHAPVIVEF